MDYYVPSKIKEKSPSFLENLGNFFTDIPLTLQKYWLFLLIGLLIAVIIGIAVAIFLKIQTQSSEDISAPDQKNMPKL